MLAKEAKVSTRQEKAEAGLENLSFLEMKAKASVEDERRNKTRSLTTSRTPALPAKLICLTKGRREVEADRLAKNQRRGVVAHILERGILLKEAN